MPGAMCDAHHAVHWADGGDTDPHNLALVCWFHHHLLHEPHWSLEPLGAGHVLLRSSDGELHEFRPPRLDLITKQARFRLA